MSVSVIADYVTAGGRLSPSDALSCIWKRRRRCWDSSRIALASAGIPKAS